MKSTIQLELNNQYKGLHASQDALCALVKTIENSGLFPIQSGELSLAFVDDKTLASIHADFMDDPSPTDVITFPAEPAMQSAGEILISVDRAIEQAHRQGAPLSHELSLYIVHGWLHLAGHEDNTPESILKMRTAENTCMQMLQEAGQLDAFDIEHPTAQ